MYNVILNSIFFGFFSTIGEWFLINFLLFSVFFLFVGTYELTIRQ
jgi:hypothetical protein